MKVPNEIPEGCEMEVGYLGGRLRLAGHRISMGQIIAEIADCDGVRLFAANYDQDEKEITRALNGLSLWLDKFNADDNATDD